MKRFTPTMRMIGGRRAAVRILTLCVFTVTSLGVPLMPAGATGCRCREGLQTSGRCCCQNATGDCAVTESCCAKKQRGSCCAAKVAACCGDQTSRSAQSTGKSEIPVLSPCHCGGPPGGALFLNAEPRLLPVTCGIALDSENGEWLTLADAAAPQRIVTPETPPPKPASV